MTDNDGTPQRKRIGIPAQEQELLSSIAADDQSLNELQQLSSGKSPEDLKREALEHEHDRTESFRDLFEWLMRIAICFAFVSVMVFGAVWVWHMLTPNTWHWLTDAQVQHIQTLFAGGVLAGLLTDHIRRRMGS